MRIAGTEQMASRWRRRWRRPSQSPAAPAIRAGMAPDLRPLLSLERSLPDPDQRLSQVSQSQFLLRVKYKFPPVLQVPQDIRLSQDSSVWWSALESGPGPHVRCEVRGAQRIPHSLSGGPGHHQDLPPEDGWHQG